MITPVPDSASVDDLDARIIRALQVSPRAPFSLIAQVLGVSEQTVARRYRRLRRGGVLRVTAVVNPRAVGESVWIIRVQCRPNGATSLAEALAQRDDITWVSLMQGGTEVMCSVQSMTSQAREDLLMQRLPRTAPVLGMAAAVVLHRYVGGSADDWARFADLLTAEQEAPLRAVAEPEAVPIPGTPLDPADRALLDVLTRDGRATYATLAAAAGSTEGRAARRVSALLRSGVAYLDVDLSAPTLGFTAQAYLWLTVTPAELHNVGRALAREREVGFAAAISGPHNVSAAVMCRDLDALYAFITDKVGAIAGVQALEVAVTLRHVKQAGALTVGDRFVDR